MLKPIRILIVEDSLLDAELVLIELERAGLNFEHHRVDTEPAYLARLEWPPDIILSDFELPRFNGMRALELLNASPLEIPFIIISGSIGEDLAVQAMKNGATDYLLKDRLARLGSCVTHALDQNRLRREKQAALQASEERFRQMAENIGEVFWMTDVASNEVLYVSPAFERVWGVPCDNLYANPRRWIECVHPEDQPRVIASEAGKLIPGGFNEEYRIIRPDGSVRWVHDSAFPIRNAEGKVYRVAGVASDITVRKQADLEVAQQRQRLAGIIDSAMDGIITINEEQRVVVFNPAAERMFGFKAEQMLGQTLDRLLPDRARGGHSEHISRFGKTGVSSRTMGSFGSITGLRATGEEFPIEASISQVQLEDQRLFTVTCRDVTEQRLAEEKRRLLEAQLQQSQKMEAFGQLAGGIAHDFNNLLVVITGYAEILSSRRDIDDDHRESVEHILTSAHQAATLTRQLLAFSRKQVLEFKVLDLNNVVGTLEKMLRRLIGEDITLTTSLGRDIERVRVDVGQMDQVVMNLVLNARDAMPDGGRVTIETRQCDIDGNHPDFGSRVPPGRYVCLRVSDTGHGMTDEVKQRIFEPFFTTKGIGKGTGLGLAVVHGIIEQSNGFISVDSEPGKGTRFQVLLPAVREAVSTGAATRKLGVQGGNEVVLLAEDEHDVRMLAAMVLKRYGYEVMPAVDANEALQIATEATKPIDILVTDVVMPGMSGRELAERLRKDHPTMKVLFQSGYTDDTIMKHGVLEEGIAFLQKPYTPGALAAKVREVLDREKAGTGA